MNSGVLPVVRCPSSSSSPARVIALKLKVTCYGGVDQNDYTETRGRMTTPVGKKSYTMQSVLVVCDVVKGNCSRVASKSVCTVFWSRGVIRQ